MARYGIIADIHGNFEALTAALTFLDVAGVDCIVCLGDVVGYNADSDRCIATLDGLGIDAIAGNHDLIAVGKLGTERCWYKAAYALRRTRETLSVPGRRYLQKLPPSRSYEGRVRLIHGGIDDPTRYLRATERVREDALALADRDPEIRYCLFGHTHEPAIHRIDDKGVVVTLPAGEQRLDAGYLHFINPGSIDAARKDHYGRAEFAIFDSERAWIRFESVHYDASYAEQKARAAGYRTNWLDDLRHVTDRQLERASRLAARLRAS